MKPWLLCAICIASLVGGDLCSAAAQGNQTRVDANRGVGERRVYLVPIGDTPALLIDTLVVHCRQKLNVSVDMLPRLGSDRLARGGPADETGVATGRAEIKTLSCRAANVAIKALAAI